MTSRPIIAFHGSPNAQIETFRPLSHFGSRAAALARAQASSKGGEPVTIYEVALHLANPILIKDLPGEGPRSPVHSLVRLVDFLHYDMRPTLLSASERQRIFAAAAPFARDEVAGAALLADILAARGIDGFGYPNRFEDPGKTSWIILRSNQVKILSRRPFLPNVDNCFQRGSRKRWSGP